MSAALGKPDGVAVVGVFYEIDRESNPKLQDVIDSVSSVTKTTSTLDVNYALKLIDLFPNNLNNFYRYRGSLTTPPCTEKIIWIVLDKPAHIGYQQIEVYRNTQNDKERQPLVNNYRETQRTRARIIEASFDYQNSGSKSLKFTAFTACALMFAFVLNTVRL